MKSETKVGLGRLVTCILRLEHLLQAKYVMAFDKIQREAIAEVIETINHYANELKSASQSENVTDALRAVNRATSVNKGLSDQGPWILQAPEVRASGVEVSDQAILLAKTLRSELGMQF